MSKPESSLDPLLAYTHNLTGHAKTRLLSRHPEYSGEAARVTEILARRHDSSGEWARYPFGMAPLLKRLLSRREIQLWGACTLADVAALLSVTLPCSATSIRKVCRALARC